MQDGWLNVSVDCSTVRLLYVDCVLTIGGCCGKERCGSQIGIISQSNFTKRPHRRRMWTVQSYSPGGANVHPYLTHAFLGPYSSPYPKRHLVRFSRFCTAHDRECLYFTMDRPFPLKVGPSHVGFGAPSYTWLLGLTRIHNPNGTSIGSADFAGLTIVTDKPRYSVCKNRPHLRTPVRTMMRPKSD